MIPLTAEDLIDLGRWEHIQFATPEAAEAALLRYREWVGAGIREYERAQYPEPPV